MKRHIGILQIIAALLEPDIGERLWGTECFDDKSRRAWPHVSAGTESRSVQGEPTSGSEAA